MGALISGLGDAVERGVQALVGRMEESSVGRFVLNLKGNKEWELGLTPEGRTIKGMLDSYNKLHDQALQTENKKVAAVQEWHRNDASARAAVPVKTGTIMQYHAHAVATGHPIQKVTQSIIDAGDGHLTQRELMVQNMQKARLIALQGSFGDHFQNLTPLIARLLTSSEPREVANGHRVADIISNQVRDTQHLPDILGTNLDQSAAKKTMNQAFKKANKFRDPETEQMIPYLKTDKTYSKQSEGERLSHRILDVVMLPFLSVKHIGQFFNPIMSSPLPAIGAALLRQDHAEMENFVDASAITASTAWSAMYRDILGESGHIAEWTKSPDAGRLIGQVTHQPGFTWLRKQQLNITGSIGFHSAIYWAHNYVESGARIARDRLTEIGIDPAEVLKQGGKLTDEQLKTGIYHYTNNRMFFNKSIDNSLWQNKNVIARAGFTYHSFVNSQVSFMRRELLLMAKAGDIKGLAQFAGTVAVLVPATAPLLAGAEKMLTTGSITKGVDETKQRYERLVPTHGVGNWIDNFIDLISYIGATGVYFNYINAIKGHRLASAAMGPLAGAVFTDVEDATNAVMSPTHNTKPIERDILRQAVPVVGGALAHHFAPTTAELKTSEGSTRRHGFSTRLRIRRRR